MTAAQTLLAQILRDNKIYYNCDLTEDDFLQPMDRHCFIAIGKILDSGNKPDSVAILGVDSSIKASYLAELDCHTTKSWKIHAKTVKEESDINRLRVLQMTIHDMLNNNESSAEIRSEVERQLTKGTKRSEVQGITAYLNKLVDDIEAAYKRNGALPGISTGFKSLDSALLGIQPMYYVIGARPSAGKTALGLQLVANMSREVPIGVISAEMSGTALVRRLLSNGSNIPLKSLKTGMIKNFDPVLHGVDKLSRLGVYIDDTPNIMLSDLKASVRSMVRVHGVKAVLIDYIGLIGNKSKIPRHEQMMEVSQSFKQLSRELDIAIIALSQVGRQADEKAPSLADLRDTGSIEQDADCVMFIHHEKSDIGIIEKSYIIIAKQRDGETGWHQVYFDGDHVRFADVVNADDR